MYTITRKLAVVCLAVVFSVLVYGCGGGSKEQALTEDVSINVDMVTAGLATPGTYTIQPGEAADAGDATFTCAAEGPTCEVTVAADGTATSVGGMATAMNSAAADARLADEAEAKRVADEAEAKRVADEEAARLAVITMLEEAIARLENAEAERIAAMEAAAKLAADEAAAKLAADEEAARLAAVKKLEDEIAMLKAAEAERLAAIAAEAERVAEAARVAAAALAEKERIAAAALAEIERVAAEEKKIADEVARILAVINPVDITPPPGLTILAGMYTIQPGETEDAGIVAFTCSAEGVRCLVTVADDGTVTSAGGAATAMITAEGYKRLYQSKIVDTGKLATGYKTITPGTYPIEPGQSMDVADATFTCPVGGVRCDVTVADDGTVTSVGGTATAKNSNAVKYTMTAIALSELLKVEGAGGPEITVSDVKNSTKDEVEITLKSDAMDEDEYSSKAVDTGHRIDGWVGQTLTRNVGSTRRPKLEEATVYTNIEPATGKKLKYDFTEDSVAVTALTLPFVLDSGQAPVAKLMTAMEFTGKYGSIPGTFTCDAATAAACALATSKDAATGEIVINTDSDASGAWTFVSNANVESASVQDDDYMYFGYWLQSPEDPNKFNVFYNGKDGADDNNDFEVTTLLVNDVETNDSLTAKYEGGAAGMYVTRKLRIDGQAVDPFSPGSSGRFTAKAVLTAIFGGKEFRDDDPDERISNIISGDITEFNDGNKDLDIKVKLNQLDISTAGIVAGDPGATAAFGKTATNDPATGSGSWSAQFFGPNAVGVGDANPTNEQIMTTLPTGVAGQFDVNSDYTDVVGAFAAEH